MSLIKKIKSQYEMWKVTKYTRRRSAMTPDFEQKDPDFYKQNYVNGVYLNYASPEQPIPKRNDSNASFVKKNKNHNKHNKSSKMIRIVSMVDIALDFADDYIFDDLYARFYLRVQPNSTFNTNVIPRENNLMKHPKFLKNQISKEIKLSAIGYPVTSLVTIPWFLVPTPYASHAFHPLDGYVQSVPYHLFVYLFPLHKYIYIGLFIFVNLWTIMIHDGKFLSSGSFINGAAHHALHHLYFNFNYGQYFTIWDKFGGSYRKPGDEQLDDKKRKDQNIWKKQSKEVDSFDENGKEKKS
ncbi:1868_t:CDS:2 [Funneliformis geosporum]|uniref:1868_t:CDS:1 n=1 Tax=Funneliformis geosporum TaxID=1117311 RepID=A0A9W4WJV5_9GLOM|nr:1868_t:CDS:2 [Funneliformis geosporum]